MMSIPKIFFESGYLMDLKHDIDHPDRAPIAERSKDRVQELMQIFDRIWTADGERLLNASISEIGRPFLRKELSCTITVSPDQFSCSHPLVVNAIKFYPLKELAETDKLMFLDTLHHELLHRLLDDHFPDALDLNSKSPSPLMLKYANEDIFTQAHMHLYALQKTVFLRLGKQKEWEHVANYVTTIPMKGYRRALEIVETEGAQTFVDELRK